MTEPQKLPTTQNPLHDFRTYSYYHVLVACDTTETAEEVGLATDPDTWFHPDDPEQTVKTTPSGGSYIVLINGATDANFVITELKWTSFQAGDTGDTKFPTSIACQGSFSVSEPRNVLFINELIQACRLLGIDYSAVPMVFKTFFVGHAFDEETGDTVRTISDIPALIIVLTNVLATYTETGGVYNLDFVSFSYGMAKLPQLGAAVDTIGITSTIDNTVSGAIKQKTPPTLTHIMKVLQDQLNTRYAAVRGCAMATLQASGVPDPEKQWGSVTYEIQVAGDYTKDEYKVIDGPAAQKDTSNCADPPIFRFKIGTTINSAIQSILACVPKIIIDDKNAGYIPRVHDITETTVVNDVLNIKVTYIVDKIQVPVQNQVLRGLTGQPITDQNLALLLQNLLVFDYIYSGKNTDVLSFDMKLNMGYAFLNSQITGGTLKNQTEVGLAKRTQLGGNPKLNQRQGNITDNQQGTRTVTPLKMPLFSPQQVSAALTKNTQYPQDKVEFMVALSRWGSLESMGGKLKIAGNPAFLGVISQTTHPTKAKQLVEQKNNPQPLQAAGQTTTTSGTADGINWSSVPVLCQINIYTPLFDDDQTLFQSGEITYTQDFWYRGFYRIIQVDNDFGSDGSFTQTLTLITMPEDNLYPQVQPGATGPQTGINNCFESNTITNATGQSPQSPPSQQPAVAVDTKKIEEENKKIVEDISKGGKVVIKTWKEAKTLFNQTPNSAVEVVSYDGLPDQWKGAITTSAGRYSISERTVAMIVGGESNNNPTAKNSRSTAEGLGQFTNQTWLSMMKTNAPETVSGKSDSQILALKTNPELSIQMTAAYMKANRDFAASKGVTLVDPDDYYALHFLGGGGGTAILKARNSGQGGTLARTVYAQAGIGATDSCRSKGINDGWDCVVASNPNLTANMTVDNVSDVVALTMAKRLKRVSGVAKVVPSNNTPSPVSQALQPPASSQTTSQTAAQVANKAEAGLKAADHGKNPPCGKIEPMTQTDSTNAIVPVGASA